MIWVKVFYLAENFINKTRTNINDKKKSKLNL